MGSINIKLGSFVVGWLELGTNVVFIGFRCGA